ncbi:hypothetical protein [Sorangium sp. So ce388]|uniref:hypothetical protein n=1 Tax=Sorangium sp. So ce388 TaxID=3133309 RepID=UPI003F5C89A3
MKHDDVHPAAASAAATPEVAALLQALLAQPVPPLSWAHEMHLQRRVASHIDQLAAEAARRGARAARRPPLRGPATALAAVLVAVVLSEVVVLRARPPAPAAARVTALQGSVEIASGGGAGGDAQAPPRGAEPQGADRDQPARNEAAAGASSAPRDPPEVPADASLSAQTH